MSQAAADRYAWIEPDVEDLGAGVYRIPLPLPLDGLKAVNIYAITDAGGVDLIDAGFAIVAARERLAAGLRQLGYGFGDVRNFLVTHVHIDHYSLAVELRREFRNVISLGEGERANLVATREMLNGAGGHKVFGAENLRRLGADELVDLLSSLEREGPMFMDWEDPDRWVADGTDLDLRTRTLRAVHTPGHTRGHLIYHDAAAEIMFAGDHVLPHITPSIGFEPAGNRMALRDYLSSLARTLALPDARLLPAHGPVSDSTHARVNELLAHHDARLAETLAAVQAGHATPFEVAKAIKWTRRQTRFGDLDMFSQVMSVNETAAHLEVLLARGQVTRETSPVGADLYEIPAR
ncbi:MAG: MBL fold metallo-hydrolase [Streptosporangiaceae bacterium]|jgi:glyoxylase-like metal-dependent hydrolase (beta-lactamase superfamily II)